MDWQSMRWHDYLSLVIGLIGVVVIIWGVLLGVAEFIKAQIRAWRHGELIPLEVIRYDVGRYILLGLEFFIAADIVHTIVQPNLEEVAILAAIVAIRTIISYFLIREMEQFGHIQNK